MTETTDCSEDCRARRPLGSDEHLATCPAFGGGLGKVVQIVRHPETQRPIAVPDEIVSEAERDYRAYKLYRAGRDWEEIAHTEQYVSAAAAAASVKRYLDEGRAVMQDLTRQEIIADHVSRLRWARSRLHAGVEAGKPAAVMAYLAIEDRWVKAFGLDQPEPGDATTHTVVVPSESYLEALRAAAESSEADAG